MTTTTQVDFFRFDENGYGGTCEKCLQHFGTIGEATEHQAICLGEPRCPWCPRTFVDWPRAKRHVKFCERAPRPRHRRNSPKGAN